MKRERRARLKIWTLLVCCAVEAFVGLYAAETVKGSGGWFIACIPLLQAVTAMLFFSSDGQGEADKMDEGNRTDKPGRVGGTGGKGKTSGIDGMDRTGGENRVKSRKNEKNGAPVSGRKNLKVKDKAEKIKAEEKVGVPQAASFPGLSFPSFGSCLYAGALTAAAILFSAPFRLLADKLLAQASYRSAFPLSYMTGPGMTVFVLLLLFPVFSEILHRRLLRQAVGAYFGRGSLPVMGLFYALSFPLFNRIALGWIYGVALEWIFRRTRSYFLTYICALVLSGFSLVYQYMILGGFSDGSAMSYAGIAGLGLIFTAVALATAGAAESLMCKRKPKALEVFVFFLVFVLLLVIGIALVSR